MWGSSLVAQLVKNMPATQETAWNAGDLGSIPGSGRSLGEGNNNPLQYSCLGNPIDRGTWQAIVHGAAKSQTRLKQPNTLLLSKKQYIGIIVSKIQ